MAKSKNWISKKIKKLKGEGKSQEQSIAIAISMAKKSFSGISDSLSKSLLLRYRAIDALREAKKSKDIVELIEKIGKDRVKKLFIATTKQGKNYYGKN